MNIGKIGFILTAGFMFSGSVAAASINLGGDYMFSDWQSGADNASVNSAVSSDRMDIGYSAGAHLEAYSASHASRPGEFLFVYGGGASAGKVVFTHYDGSAWNERMVLDSNGNLGIGLGPDKVPCADCALAVKGKVVAEEVVVTTTGWPDYVFHEDYNLVPLSTVSSYINEHGRLPGVPSAAEVEKNGISVSKMTNVLMEKVEELTLHMIRLERENAELKTKVNLMQAQGSAPMRLR